MSTLPDLITLGAAQSELAASLPTDQSALGAVITAASSAIRQYTRGNFSLANYVELLDGRGFSEILTRQRPVNSISRLLDSPLDRPLDLQRRHRDQSVRPPASPPPATGTAV